MLFYRHSSLLLNQVRQLEKHVSYLNSSPDKVASMSGEHQARGIAYSDS